MPGIKLIGFAGEQPLLQPELLPAAGAQAAVNVRLRDGGLSPIKRPVLDGAADDADHMTIFKNGSDWLSWETEVHVVPGAIASDRLYFTGDGVPKMLVGATEYELGVEAPTAALTATPSGSGSGDVYSRVYVYTHVTDFGEESEPNAASAVVAWQAGKTITLSGFGAVPSGRNITKQRIYRSQTGADGTLFYFIAERAAGTGNYADTIPVDAFQEPLPSTDWNPPPDDLAGLISLPNGGMAGFSGKDLCFCEPYHHHAWPEKYRLRTAYPIVALGAVGSSVVVMTTGNPEFANGTHPATMVMARLEQNRPCINSRAVVDMGAMIAYPTNDGLVAVDASGNSRLVTAKLFDRDTWLELGPDTMVAGQHGDRYMAFYDTFDADDNPVFGAVFIDLGDAPYLIRTDTAASAVFYEVETGALFYLERDSSAIYRFDAPSGAAAAYYWKSKAFRLATPDNFGWVRVDAALALTGQEALNAAALVAEIMAANQALMADPIGGELGGSWLDEYPLGGDSLSDVPNGAGFASVGVYADGILIHQVARTNRPERMPSGFKAEIWEVDVTGDLVVKQVVIGKTVEDLKAA